MTNFSRAKKRPARAHDRAQLAPLKRDLAWLRTRLNAGTDPLVQRYIAEVKAKIEAIRKEN